MGIVIWASNYLIAILFLPLLSLISLGGVFLGFGLICLVGFVVFYRYLPETKQKTLSEIEALLSDPSKTVAAQSNEE